MQAPNDNQTTPFTFMPIHHQTAHSEVNFPLSDLVPDQFDPNFEYNFDGFGDIFADFIDIENLGVSPNFGSGDNAGGIAAAVVEEGGVDGDGEKLTADVETANSRPRLKPISGDNAGSSAAAVVEEGGGDGDGEKLTADVETANSRPRLKPISSDNAGGSAAAVVECGGDGDGEKLPADVETANSRPRLKPISGEKLAELHRVHPKRAKRILANRMAAARSKEKKLRHISDLESEVQALETQAYTIASELTMSEKYTSGLDTKNKELKIRLQEMEQLGQLRYDLNEELKQEVERLKIVTGEAFEQADAYNLEMQQQTLYHHSQFVLDESRNTMLPHYDMPHPSISNHPSEPQHQNTRMPYDMPHPSMSNHPSEPQHQNTRMPQYDMPHPSMSNHPSEPHHQNTWMPQYDMPHSNLSNHHSHLLAPNHAHAHSFLDMLDQDSLDRLQGLDMESYNSHLVRHEGPSISVGENNSSF